MHERVFCSFPGCTNHAEYHGIQGGNVGIRGIAKSMGGVIAGIMGSE